MNLLEFAVQRKLEHEDQLLDYVAKHKDVPVDVLSTSLADIIGPLEDRRASLLVKNYTEMLSEYVPMTYKRDAQTGEYTVEGEIDESILDSISLVHDIDAESAISDMIEENIRVLTNTPAEVHGLNMGELERVATKLSTQTIQTMSDDVAESFNMDEVLADIPDEDMSQDILEDIPIEEESAVEDVVEEAIQEVAVEAPEPLVEEIIEEPVVEEVLEEIAVTEEPEPEIEAGDLDQTLDGVIDEAVADEAVPEEAPEEAMTDEEEEQLIAEKMKRIYVRLVEDIKAAGLDKSLGLAL